MSSSALPPVVSHFLCHSPTLSKPEPTTVSHSYACTASSCKFGWEFETSLRASCTTRISAVLIEFPTIISLSITVWPLQTLSHQIIVFYVLLILHLCLVFNNNRIDKIIISMKLCFSRIISNGARLRVKQRVRDLRVWCYIIKIHP